MRTRPPGHAGQPPDRRYLEIPSARWDSTLFILLRRQRLEPEVRPAGPDGRDEVLQQHPPGRRRVGGMRLGTTSNRQTIRHCAIPWGWAFRQAARTAEMVQAEHPRRRRALDPLIMSWPARLTGDEAACARRFCHAIDILPTVLDALGIDQPPGSSAGVPQMPVHGVGLACSRC